MLVEPQSLIDAADRIGAIGAGLHSAARAIGAVPVMGADEVSAVIAELFSAQAQEYQSAAQQMTALRAQLEQTLAASSQAYGNSEDTNQVALEYAAARDRLWHQTHSIFGGPNPPGTPLSPGWWVWQLVKLSIAP